MLISVKGGESGMKKYRIGQLAKKMSVSLDFIRFYEEKGLIESTVDRNNHYHYYDISQSEIIQKIQEYRRLGFNVNETVDLLKRSDKTHMVEMYAARKATLLDNIKKSEYAVRYLSFLQTALTTENGTWYVSRMPPLWFLPHTLNDDYLEDLSVQATFSTWSTHVPLIYSIDKWVIAADGTLDALYHGRAVDCSVAADFGLQPSSPFELYPEKRCLEYYMDHQHSPDFNLNPSIGLRTIQNALDILKQKQFEIDGDVFVRLIASYKENGRQNDRFVVYIPIK